MHRRTMGADAAACGPLESAARHAPSLRDRGERLDARPLALGRPRSILFACPLWIHGGTETVVASHLSHLRRELFTPSLLVGRVGSRELPAVPWRVEPGAFEGLAPADDPAAFERARARCGQLLAVARPDVLVGQLSRALFLAADDVGVPLVVDYWHMAERERPMLPVHLAVAVSHFVLEAAGWPAHVAQHVNYNGVDSSTFGFTHRDATRRELGVDDQTLVVGFCGRLVPEKRPELWLRTLAELRRREPRTRGLLLGNAWTEWDADPVLAAVRDVASREGLRWGEDVLQRAVPHELMPRYYSALDVLLHTCPEEPFGMVIPEALRCGTPVVAMDAAGPHEIGRVLGSNPYLRLVREPDALAEAVCEVAGRRCVGLDLGVFDAQACTRRLEQLLLDHLPD